MEKQQFRKTVPMVDPRPENQCWCGGRFVVAKCRTSAKLQGERCPRRQVTFDSATATPSSTLILGARGSRKTQTLCHDIFFWNICCIFFRKIFWRTKYFNVFSINSSPPAALRIFAVASHYERPKEKWGQHFVRNFCFFKKSEHSRSMSFQPWMRAGCRRLPAI